ncbi:hypothetical protein P7L78_16240 [Tistrella bauzanensis]|uniref:Uncharacterized protein n=1 Tax=Tistrella arctica TaxID=3133430 RepID=A0ABU9YEG6_9PROT
MIYSTATVPVNPEGDIRLTREQAEQQQFDSEDKGYRSALLSTLRRTRELLAVGRL